LYRTLVSKETENAIEDDRKALIFAQLHWKMPFVQISTVTELFIAVVLTPNKRKQNALVKFCLEQLVNKQGKTYEDALFYVKSPLEL